MKLVMEVCEINAPRRAIYTCTRGYSIVLLEQSPNADMLYDLGIVF